MPVIAPGHAGAASRRTLCELVATSGRGVHHGRCATRCQTFSASTRGRHVVHPHDGRATLHGRQGRGHAGRQALVATGPARDFDPACPCATSPRAAASPVASQLLLPPQQGQVVLGRLREADARVEHEAVRRDAGGLRPQPHAAQEGRAPRPRRRLYSACCVHVGRLAAHVHQAHTGPAAGSPPRRPAHRGAAIRAHVVDDVGPGRPAPPASRAARSCPPTPARPGVTAWPSQHRQDPGQLGVGHLGRLGTRAASTRRRCPGCRHPRRTSRSQCSARSRRVGGRAGRHRRTNRA